LYGIDNVRGYFSSALSKKFEAGRDTFYRFKNNQLINWRNILYNLNKRILKRVDSDPGKGTMPTCLIIDDTDLRKTGKFIEHVGYIWSHVRNSFVLGYKGLFLGYWDGKSFLCLDFSLHKEEGKNKERKYGLTSKELRVQYKKSRDMASPGYVREKELTTSKIENTIALIKNAVRRGVRFDYALMDSWFVCRDVIKAVIKANGHLLGMVKRGKAKYSYQGYDLTVQQIHNRLKRNKKYNRSRKLKMFIGVADCKIEGMDIKLFFYKGTNRDDYHVLLSTNTGLTPLKAYEIYSIRWSIEVFFKEGRKYFNLGKSQAEDFDGQIADITISILQYNIFSIAKRANCYEHLGELFKELDNQIMEHTMAERIWGLILELLNIFSGLFEVDLHELISKLFHDEANQAKLHKIIAVYRANAA
jgi:hypothetical protein